MGLKIKSILLVLIQFSCIGFLVFNCHLNRSNTISIIIIGFSVTLAFWAICAMQKSTLRIFPEPSQSAILITNGPYQYIRHPMYTSVLLSCFGLVLTNLNFASVICFLLLLLDLTIKLHWEEILLEQKFEEYRKYKSNSKRLIPFIY